MKQKSPLILRVLGASFGFISLLCLYGVGHNLWIYARMRTIPVEVVRSSLLVDIPSDSTGDPNDIDYTLRLDLLTTDGSARPIHWEDIPARAAYPEEAFDELTRWAPGARHNIFQLRGEARAIRLPGSVVDQELSSAIGFFAATVFFGLFTIAILTTVGHEDSWFRNSKLRRIFGAWLVFAFVGVGALTADFIFLSSQLPKIVSWPTATATLQSAPSEYEPQNLPPNVQITPAARKRLQTYPHNVLTFQWNGATLHGGLGANEGPYDELAREVCISTSTPCQFRISATDRWNVAAKPGWNAEFFMPVGMFTLFGVAFTGAGLMIRRHEV